MSPINQTIANVSSKEYGLLEYSVSSTPVQSGLVLYWDFAPGKSYTGSGTSVSDLSGNGNNGTINGSGTYSSSTYGGTYLLVTGGNTINTSSPNLSSSNYTVMGSTKLTGSANNRVISSQNNNWLLGNWGGYINQYYAEGWVNGAGSSGGLDTNWHIWTGTGRGTYTFYNNNSLITSNSSGSQGPNGFAINQYVGNTYAESSNAYFGFLLVYNRVLTTDEMTYNYNIFKARYGL